jgi:glycosyltransferase involved in cell wall biosynthesis
MANALAVCVIGKYPPIQGGVSAHTLWLSRWLAAAGHDVHVVTNAGEVEDDFRIFLTAEDERWLRAPARLSIHETEPLSTRYEHIPQSNPFVTKLAALASEVVETHAIDVVLAYYLEPFGVAASMAAAWTGRPYLIRHAGSDIGRLARLPGLRPAYAHVLRNADAVCASPSTFGPLVALGVPELSLQPAPGFVLPPDVFHPEASVLDVAAVGRGPGPLDPAIPTLGIYGKLGSRKGIYDLVEVLGELKRTGRAFQLLAMCHGRSEARERFRTALRVADIEQETRILPFLPHWKVPSFLRTLTAACFLENRFPIAMHTPGVPREVMSCGTALVMSVEAARKQPFARRIVHGENALLVRDPEDHDELREAVARVLDAPDWARELGLRGAEIARSPVSVEACVRRHEQLLRHVADRRRPTGTVATSPERRLGYVGTQYFPMTVRLLDAAGVAPDDVQLTGGGEVRERAVQIAEALARLLEVHHLPPYVGEVLRWELLMVPAADRSEDEVDRMLFRGAASPAHGDDDLSIRPAARSNVMCIEFAYEMEPLLELGANPPRPLPEEWPLHESYYAFHYLSSPRALRVAPFHYAVLLLCDGEQTVSQIARALEVESDRDAEAARRVLTAVWDLFAEGLIALRPRERRIDEQGAAIEGGRVVART